MLLRATRNSRTVGEAGEPASQREHTLYRYQSPKIHSGHYLYTTQFLAAVMEPEMVSRTVSAIKRHRQLVEARGEPLPAGYPAGPITDVDVNSLMLVPATTEVTQLKAGVDPVTATGPIEFLTETKFTLRDAASKQFYRSQVEGPWATNALYPLTTDSIKAANQAGSIKRLLGLSSSYELAMLHGSTGVSYVLTPGPDGHPAQHRAVFTRYLVDPKVADASVIGNPAHFGSPRMFSAFGADSDGTVQLPGLSALTNTGSESDVRPWFGRSVLYHPYRLNLGPQDVYVGGNGEWIANRGSNVTRWVAVIVEERVDSEALTPSDPKPAMVQVLEFNAGGQLIRKRSFNGEPGSQIDPSDGFEVVYDSLGRITERRSPGWIAARQAGQGASEGYIERLEYAGTTATVPAVKTFQLGTGGTRYLLERREFVPGRPDLVAREILFGAPVE
jgi:hypothetical protein